MKINLTTILLFATLLPISAAVIDSVNITGAIISRRSTLDRLIRVTPGTPYSDSLRESVRTSLERSTLYDSVTVDTISSENSEVNLNISLNEKEQFFISDIGGGINSTRYGKTTDLPWLQINLGLTYRNIKGTGQKLKLYGSVWRNRHMGAVWQVPLPKRYFLETGASIGSFPSLHDEWHAYKAFKSTIGIGKEIAQNHTVKLNISPHHTDYDLLTEERNDRFWELLTTLKWRSDFRDQRFNPLNGLFFEQSLSSNFLHPHHEFTSQNKEIFLRGVSDIRGYLSPWNKKLTFAVQVKGDITYAGKLSRYNRQYLGGLVLRGFPAGSFGTEKLFNNSATASGEFRFHIFSVRGLNLSFLSWYDKSLRDFPFDVKGVVFVNAGYLWDSIENSFDRNTLYHTAAAAGTGIRVMFPTLQMSACGDIGWPVHAPQEFYKIEPTLHAYINLPF